MKEEEEEGWLEESGARRTRERGRTSGLAWVCWRLPVVFFSVAALLPCGANGDSMCVMSEDGLSQHPKEASRLSRPPSD